MTTQEQIKLIQDLTESVTHQLVEDIQNEKVPQNWDGLELRQLLDERFNQQTLTHFLQTPRGRDYRNTVNTENL